MPNRILICLTFLAACITTNVLAQIKVFYQGTMRETMYQNKTTASASMNEIAGSGRIGIGPLVGMAGEITLINDTAFVSRVGSSGITTSVDPNAGAPFFVWSNVKEWKQVRLRKEIKNISDLEILVASAAKENGIDTNDPFPFIINTKISSAVFHILKAGENATYVNEKFRLANEPGQLVGFYSIGHKGIFIHHELNSHIHFLSSSREQMGHLDEVSINNQDIDLLLPVK